VAPQRRTPVWQRIGQLVRLTLGDGSVVEGPGDVYAMSDRDEADVVTPLSLWRQADGDREMYRRLLIHHGMLVERCQFIAEGSRRRCVLPKHEGNHNLDPVNIFGHPERRK
jgi:hypothetical protein